MSSMSSRDTLEVRLKIRRMNKSVQGKRDMQRRCKSPSTRMLFHTRKILDIFFSIHDPTTLNRQGADAGTQYRSAIFVHNEQQATYANALILHLNREKIWTSGIVTQVVKFEKFYPAEEYHRDYFSKHPEQGYCQVVISPKLSKFRKEWASSLKKHI